MKEELRERVFSYIKKNQMTEQMGAAVIGVSGGADSVCLLLLLMELRERLGLELLAVHVEHGIRGESSLADAEFVRRLCDRLQIPCVVHSENILRLAAERHTSVEETARNVRYAVFAEEADRLVKRSGKKCCIAVAHNANDNAETMLHHLARGDRTSWPGRHSAGERKYHTSSAFSEAGGNRRIFKDQRAGFLPGYYKLGLCLSEKQDPA